MLAPGAWFGDKFALTHLARLFLLAGVGAAREGGSGQGADAGGVGAEVGAVGERNRRSDGPA
jgi:hypothetical protein